jgi:hypothetical protein
MIIPNDYRAGNIVEYYGPAGHFSNAKISEVRPVDEDRLMFSIQNPYYPEESFVAYSNHVRPLFLRDFHLERLGFELQLPLKLYSKDEISIRSIGYAKGEDRWNLTFVDLGFRILPEDFPETPTLEQVENDTKGIVFIHELQNYCQDKGIDSIDFSVLR